jgi:hypothetical protein
MLAAKTLWVITTALCYALLVGVAWLWPTVLGGGSALSRIGALNWVYTFAFLVFGIVLQALTARILSSLTASLWRPVMLVVGAALAWLHMWLMQVLTGVPPSVELWMSALLGLAVVALIARVLPASVLARWYGVVR